MWAFVYVKALKKYFYIEEENIESFEFEREGHQIKAFASKPFSCIIDSNETSQICQILIVAETKESVLQMVKDQRPRVPKLSNSDLNIESQQSKLSVQQEQRRTRKDLESKRKKSSEKSNSEIIAKHVSALNSSNTKPTDETKKSKPTYSDNNSDDECTRSPLGPDRGGRSDTEEFIEDNEISEMNDVLGNIANTPEIISKDEKIKQLLHENEILKKKNFKLTVTSKKTISVATIVNEKYEALKQSLNEKNIQEHPISEVQESRPSKEKKKKVAPEPINTQSNIFVRADVLDTAYSKVKPSAFYEHMCYAAWGHKELSERCVKQTKKTMHLKVVTPKKRRVIKKHFVHFLDHWEYPNLLYKIYLSEMNMYAHRAIVNAKSHMKLIQNYPNVANVDDENIEMTEL